MLGWISTFLNGSQHKTTNWDNLIRANVYKQARQAGQASKVIMANMADLQR